MSSVVISGDSSGAVTLQAPNVAGTTVLTLPTSNGTVVVTGGAQTIEFADGSAAAPSITNSGDTNTGMFFPAEDTVAFTEGGVERLRITPNGAVAFSGASNFGSSGQVLRSNGDAAPTWVTPSGGFTSMDVFTSGSGTWTIPTGVTVCKITVVGGGGNGRVNSSNNGFGGGGGGAAIRYYTGLTPGNTISYTVGAAAGTSSVSSGTQTITSISATGGATANTTAGDGGIGSGGNINISGSGGGSWNNGSPGFGGSSIFGGGARQPNQSSTTGVNGGQYGGGGSGNNGTTGAPAGAGGVVIIEY